MFFVRIAGAFIVDNETGMPRSFAADQAVEVAEQWNTFNPGAPAIVMEDDQKTVFWADPNLTA